jgi:hypothetical protein
MVLTHSGDPEAHASVALALRSRALLVISHAFFVSVVSEQGPSKIRLLTAEVAVVHVHSEFRPKGHPGKTVRNVITAVLQKRESKWEIVAFHNAPVQKREGEDAGFVIRVVRLDQTPREVR